jgi:hypothetical protein
MARRARRVRLDRAAVTAVVHLVWGPLGPERLRDFLDSYRRYPAGLAHELVVLFNGVSGEQRPALLAELDGIEHTLMTLEEPVQDLVAYRRAAERLGHGRICFMNSYSVILAPGWLAKLTHAIEHPAAGIAGATGSWASLRSLALNGMFLPNPYRRVVPRRRVVIEQFQQIELDLQRARARAPTADGQRRSRLRLGPVRVAVRVARGTLEQLVRFQGFPAAHLRTNAFILERELFTQLRIGAIGRKVEAYELESGRHSITRQIGDVGLHPLLVDRDGALYRADEWARSATFWQGDQQRLLVADNQTGIYARGGLERRRLLSALAWGDQADPTIPDGASANLVARPEPPDAG